MEEKKILAEVKFRDLADLIFVLSDQARRYFDIDECDELIVNQFTEWLYTKKGSIQLTESIPRPRGEK